MKMEPITKTSLDLNLVSRGKVRDIYSMNNHLLMVSSDRLSAFDVVFSEGIPYKGVVLNQVSIFWFMKTTEIIQNHFITDAVPARFPADVHYRSMIVEKAEPVKLECVVRGYLTGSGWKDYQKTGKVCGIELPEGLKNGSELPKPIFTPSTKAESGHDIPVTHEEAISIAGEKTFRFLKQKSIELYNYAKNHARRCGLVLADTKFEFGYFTRPNGIREIILIDEVLTPDSSRYWLKEDYEQGKLLSLDKQYVRDYLEGTNWNKTPPPPPLPGEVVKKTSERYLLLYNMLTGKDLLEELG